MNTPQIFVCYSVLDEIIEKLNVNIFSKCRSASSGCHIRSENYSPKKPTINLTYSEGVTSSQAIEFIKVNWLTKSGGNLPFVV